MHVAIIGAGVSGITVAALLAGQHEITLFESADYLGGHTHTLPVMAAGRSYPIDTGFIVCNDRTYPNFLRLLRILKVATQPSDMSFSVSCEQTGLEYCGDSLAGLFAQRRNLLRPKFYGLLRDIVRFNRAAVAHLDQHAAEQHEDEQRTSAMLAAQQQDAEHRYPSHATLTLRQFLARHRFGGWLVDKYLLPMSAAIWSADPGQMLDFPAAFLLRFFHNHGLLSLHDRPQWLTVRGGSWSYVRAIAARLGDSVRLSFPVRCVTRQSDCVTVTTDSSTEQFDEVVLAVHADVALRMLADASAAERSVLGSFAYQANDVVLHTDQTVLPQRKRAWASWNYRIPREPRRGASVSYWMNRLQRLDAPEDFCVTLNSSQSQPPEKVIARMKYHHPLYTTDAVAAQRRRAEISGVRRTHYCGAYWGHGFHEDGVNSALAVARRFGRSLADLESAPATLPSTMAGA